MDFRFTEDQQDLIDAAKSVFDGENTVERMRSLVEQGGAEKMRLSLWSQFTELGLLGIMVPESLGGLGQDLILMTGIAEAAGYSGLVEPYIETAGITIPLLCKYHANNDLAREALNNLLTNKNLVSLNSNLNSMNFANHAREVVETFENEILVFWTGAAGITRHNSIDPLRDIYFAKNRGRGNHNALSSHHGAVLTAAQLVGLSQRMVDMSVEYAKERQQFGKPIGSFQAIKHHLATVYTQIEFTRPMVHLAALQGGRAVHTAKIAAIDTAMLAAETAIQVHGGMGYTFEVDLHLFMKRAWALCGEWGDRNYHMKKLEDLILDGDAPIGAGTTFQA